MSKIKLYTYLDNYGTYLNSTALLKQPHKGPIKTTFILDTGSPNTIINYNDSRRLQLPFNERAPEKIINIGGQKFQAYLYKSLKASFRSENDEVVREELKNVRVVRPTSQDEFKEASKFPTILGSDFLKDNKFKLFCDFANKEAYLEK